MACRHVQQVVDVHNAVAAEVFGVPLGQVTPEMRVKAKTVCFGSTYGQTATSLANLLGLSGRETRTLVTAYSKRFPANKEKA